MTKDPLLGMFPATTLGVAQQQRTMDELQQENQLLNQKLEQLKQMRASGAAGVRTQTPVWDEIDGIVRGMNEQEVQAMAGNEEYKESEAAIQAILQREYLRIMRPAVEGTKDGKDALEKHLTLIKRLQKSAKDEAVKKQALIDEYLSGYSHMPFDEFLKMKQEGGK